ncbi:MAG TPA: EamA family transporter, partial [Planctomycetes bacterium]|nr:EamA family transporter [Planctomycetota bacterium]
DPDFAARPGRWALAVPGICFAADLATWHLAFELTTAANATVLANLAVLIVALAGYLFLGERFDWRLPAGALLGLVGVTSLIRLSLAAETVGPDQWKGDLISLATAASYAGYILSVKWLRRGYGALPILVASSAVGGALCFVLALAHGEALVPAQSVGWLYLLGLGLLTHCVGQGLVAVSLKRLPASLVSVLLLTQPVHVAWLGALLLSEPLSLAQAGSMGLVLLAVGLAIYGRRAASSS